MGKNKVYNPEGFALDIFKKRYAFYDGETWLDACKRVSAHVACAENPDKLLEWQDKFTNMLQCNLFMPGGRIWYGSGRPKGQLLNCFVTGTNGDSREGWGESVKNMIIITGTGGGLGSNFSPIRPRGTSINGTGGFATGAVSLMEIMNSAGEVIKAGGGRRCLPEGTLIHTNRGAIPIEKVVTNDLVMTERGYKLVTGWVYQGQQKTIKLVLESGVVFKCTPNHRIAVLTNVFGDYEFKTADALVKGDRLLFVTNSIDGCSKNLKPLPDKRKADHSGSVIKQPILDEETAWILGYLFANGCVRVGKMDSRGKEGNCEFSFSCPAKKPQIVEKLVKWMTSHGLKARVRQGTVNGKLGQWYTVTSSNRQIARWASNYKTSKEILIIPDEILEAPENIKLQFVAGVMDGDGSLAGKPTLIVVTVYEKFVRDMAKLLATVGVLTDINFQIRKNKNWKTLWKLTVKDKFSKDKLSDSLNNYLMSGPIIKKDLARNGYTFPNDMVKRDVKYSSYCNKWCGKGDMNSTTLNKITGISNFIPVSFIKLEEDDYKETYDLEVQDGGVFVAEGFLVHNTALMFCLNISHGDIIEFLDKKLDLNKLNNANVSVVFNEDPEIFFNKVKNDEIFQLTFNGKVIGEISAKILWNKIVKNALTGGEPGLLNGFLANKMSNIWYYKPLLSTNPCGEIWLEDAGSCCLGAVVLPRFINSSGTMEWALLKEVITIAVRFLDNVLTVNQYPYQAIRENNQNVRRIGLGVTGLHDMLLSKGLKYNSHDGLEFVNKVMNFIKNCAYEASIELAVEKGSFPKFDANQLLKSGFAKTLKPSIRAGIKDRGLRNCALLTIAPVGTGSIVCACTSGIESMFAAAYERKYRDGNELKTEIVVHPLFKQFIDAGMDVSHFQGAHDLSMRDHFEMQTVCQRHLDNACSKTINVPQGVSENELSDLYMEFLPYLKGVTIYPEGSRADQPLTPISLDQARQYVLEGVQIGSSGMDSCKSGKCDI